MTERHRALFPSLPSNRDRNGPTTRHNVLPAAHQGLFSSLSVRNEVELIELVLIVGQKRRCGRPRRIETPSVLQCQEVQYSIEDFLSTGFVGAASLSKVGRLPHTARSSSNGATPLPNRFRVWEPIASLLLGNGEKVWIRKNRYARHSATVWVSGARRPFRDLVCTTQKSREQCTGLYVAVYLIVFGRTNVCQSMCICQGWRTF